MNVVFLFIQKRSWYFTIRRIAPWKKLLLMLMSDYHPKVYLSIKSIYMKYLFKFDIASLFLFLKIIVDIKTLLFYFNLFSFLLKRDLKSYKLSTTKNLELIWKWVFYYLILFNIYSFSYYTVNSVETVNSLFVSDPVCKWEFGGKTNRE